MLLTDARRAARTTAAGDLVPLDDQDRSLWDRAQIDEGVRLLDDALAVAAARPVPDPGRDCGAAFDGGDGPRHRLAADCGALPGASPSLTPTPVVELNAAVAMGMSGGLSHALDGIARVEARGELTRYHLLPAAKADVLRRLGRRAEAAVAYRAASRWSPTPPSAGSWSGGWPSAAFPELHSLFPDRLMCSLASADTQTKPHMSDLRIDKRRVTATLTLTGGDRLIGSLFLAEQAEHHAGPERLLDVLNGPPGFLPFESVSGPGVPADRARQPREHRGGPHRLGARGPGRRPRVSGGRAEVGAPAVRQRRRASRRPAGAAPGADATA